jgi:hypothetical protein
MMNLTPEDPIEGGLLEQSSLVDLIPPENLMSRLQPGLGNPPVGPAQVDNLNVRNEEGEAEALQRGLGVAFNWKRFQAKVQAGVAYFLLSYVALAALAGLLAVVSDRATVDEVRELAGVFVTPAFGLLGVALAFYFRSPTG